MLHLAPFTLPNWFDYGATFMFAMAGSLLGLRKGYDMVGVFSVAFASSVGGGLLRDGLFLQQGPPVITTNGTYIILIILGAMLGVMFQKFIPRLQLAIELTDALGLGAYAVVGCNKAMMAGMALPGVVLVGVVNAVGGGILRAILVREEPLMFKPGQFYVAVAIMGCLIYVLMYQFPALGHLEAGLISIACTFTLRLLAIRFNWQTPVLTRPEAPVAPSPEA